MASTSHSTMTADELFALPDDHLRHELVRGEHRMMSPAGARHGRFAGRLFALLDAHLRAGAGGMAFGAETGFVLARSPDTMRAPDAAFVTRDRWKAIGDTERYWPEAPAFAAEVVSPSDTFREVEEKALMWLDAGSVAVLVVDPERRTATVYRARDDVRAYEPGAELDLSDAVPGFRLSLTELFA